MPDLDTSPDVLVVGGGNAALCAAITAREAGAAVQIVESAPKPYRGGNSRHTISAACTTRRSACCRGLTASKSTLTI